MNYFFATFILFGSYSVKDSKGLNPIANFQVFNKFSFTEVINSESLITKQGAYIFTKILRIPNDDQKLEKKIIYF